MSDAKTRLIFLGPPGAGKGTQANMLSETLDVPPISTGDMLRAARRENTELGQEAAEFMDAGELVPDEVVIGIVEERLQADDLDNGFILDGFPRTLEQAKALEETDVDIEAVLNFEVPAGEVVRRLSGRLNCPECGAIFHELFDPPETDDVCDKCGYKGLETRKDDKPEAVRQRLQEYEEVTAPLVDFYEERDLLISIDATGNPEEVYREVESALGIS